MVWRIDKNGEREQITTAIGDIWQDGRDWKIQLPRGIATTKTKKRAQLFSATALRDSKLDAAVEAYSKLWM